MKLKFFKPPPKKLNKERLYRLAIREAIWQLVANDIFPNEQAARKHILGIAKSNYNKR